MTDNFYYAMHPLKEPIESNFVRIELRGASCHLRLWALEQQLLEILL
jgi:hypothetical protein